MRIQKVAKQWGYRLNINKMNLLIPSISPGETSPWRASRPPVSCQKEEKKNKYTPTNR